jgi:predicted RNase H-like HicB family nuclease
MLTQYIPAAMRKANYEILDDRSFYGEIPGFGGVYAHASTLEECREQLQEVLEGWIVLGLRMGHRLPEIQGVSLDPNEDAKNAKERQEKITIPLIRCLICMRCKHIMHA